MQSRYYTSIDTLSPMHLLTPDCYRKVGLEEANSWMRLSVPPRSSTTQKLHFYPCEFKLTRYHAFDPFIAKTVAVP